MLDIVLKSVNIFNDYLFDKTQFKVINFSSDIRKLKN